MTTETTQAEGQTVKILPPNVIYRDTFDAMSQRARMAFILNGGRLVDREPAPQEEKPREHLKANQIRRKRFDAMTQRRRWQFVRGGGQVVD